MLLEGFGDGCEVQDCQQRDPCFASPRHPRHGCLRPSPVQITGFRSEAGSGVPWDSKQGTYKFLPVPRGLTSRKRCALHILENSPEAARIPARRRRLLHCRRERSPDCPWPASAQAYPPPAAPLPQLRPNAPEGRGKTAAKKLPPGGPGGGGAAAQLHGMCAGHGWCCEDSSPDKTPMRLNVAKIVRFRVLGI